MIDKMIDKGYETLYDLEMHSASKGTFLTFILPQTHNNRSKGINNYYNSQKYRVDSKQNSKFLASFYRG
jgi:hypothetical protein